MAKELFLTFQLIQKSPLPIRRCAELVEVGRLGGVLSRVEVEGVESLKKSQLLSFTPHPSPLPTRERELQT